LASESAALQATQRKGGLEPLWFEARLSNGGVCCFSVRERQVLHLGMPPCVLASLRWVRNVQPSYWERPQALLVRYNG
jgi:hypothetical protein